MRQKRCFSRALLVAGSAGSAPIEGISPSLVKLGASIFLVASSATGLFPLAASMFRNTYKLVSPLPVLTVLFFMSGIAGLIYQVAWQRVLFMAFGSDLESVTIVVSAFMLGLGIGALGGGWVADRSRLNTLTLFSLCEAGIGIYGLISYRLISHVGDLFVGSILALVAGVNFLLILIPAALMGATLPILVTYASRQWNNVGRATGHLYGANTLGAAVGALGSVFFLFNVLHLDTSIYLAASINLMVASSAYLLLKGGAE